MQEASAGGMWYLFLHQVPPQPQYFRARVLRQLNQLGALAVKKSAYAIPANEETLEDLQWLRQSIVTDGGDAWIFRADAVAGHRNEDLRAAFLKARGEDYAAIAADARALLESLRSADPNDAALEQVDDSETRTRKLKRRFEAVQRVDYFGAPQRQEVLAMIHEIELRQITSPRPADESAAPANEYHGRRWVTRRGVKVDRMASAWLIRRFIDPSPEFAFVDPAAYRHTPRELRFDMFEGEFTHDGNKCTFEVLIDRMKLKDDALAAVAEIVHDIDMKEPVHRRGETAGVSSIVDGIVRRHADDHARLEAGAALFDSLYASLRQ